MFEVVKLFKGKETVVMVDKSMTKVKARKRELEKSVRRGVNGQIVAYIVRPSTATESFK